jgi:hypothetical protein
VWGEGVKPPLPVSLPQAGNQASADHRRMSAGLDEVLGGQWEAKHLAHRSSSSSVSHGSRACVSYPLGTPASSN